MKFNQESLFFTVAEMKNVEDVIAKERTAELFMLAISKIDEKKEEDARYKGLCSVEIGALEIAQHLFDVDDMYGVITNEDPALDSGKSDITFSYSGKETLKKLMDIICKTMMTNCCFKNGEGEFINAIVRCQFDGERLVVSFPKRAITYITVLKNQIIDDLGVWESVDEVDWSKFAQ